MLGTIGRPRFYFNKEEEDESPNIDMVNHSATVKEIDWWNKKK